MEAAARLFRDKGYSATSMRDLAREVNLQASSLYNHINSKQEILKDICFHNAERFLLEMNIVEQEASSAVKKAEKLIRLHIRMAVEDVTSITAFNDEWRYLEEPHLSAFIELRKDYEQRFMALLQEGIENNELKQIPDEFLLNTVLSSVRWIYDWHKPGRSIAIKKIEEQLLSIILSGIKE